jgi:hypothetical protein
MSTETASRSWTLPRYDGSFSCHYLRVPLRHGLPSERHRIFLNVIPLSHHKMNIPQECVHTRATGLRCLNPSIVLFARLNSLVPLTLTVICELVGFSYYS